MLQAVVSTATRWLGQFNRAWFGPRGAATPVRHPLPLPSVPLGPLECLRLTDGVGRTLFEEYAAHRQEARGDEEIGWILLGLRQATDAVVLATLPAGAQRDASVSHVRFNSNAQAVGSLIVRQADRRIRMLGVVHTHPGSLRHPSDGDYAGDSQWVKVVRANEGIFGIGTADAREGSAALFAEQPKPHVQTMGPLRLSWYSLRAGAPAYRPLPVSLTIGPDLARPLHAVWTTVEAHAERLERLARQQAGVTFSVADDERGQALEVQVPLAEPGAAVRARVTEKEVRYYLVRDGRLFEADCGDDRVDRGIYLLLAELAAQE
jgi:proteasome lid subunit RPN8/RPN11